MRALPWLVAGAPRWVGALLGVVLIAAGGFLLLRPLTALAVLGVYIGISCVLSGIADLSAVRDDDDTESSRWAVVVPLLWIIGGLLIAVWFGRDVDLLGPAVGVLLVLSGLVAVVRWAVRPGMDRAIAALFGVAQLLFGVLAVLWPDATLVVVGVLFGGRTVIFGILLLLRALRPPPDAGAARRRRRTGLRLTGAVTVLALAVATIWLGTALSRGAGVPDDFYDTPADLPAQAGVLIRSEPFPGTVPAGMTGDRIYYTTTDAFGAIVPSSGILLTPADRSTPAPLITWAHGTVGIARECAPSLRPSALGEPGVPAVNRLAQLGWAMVATDYPGMGAEGRFPYLIGLGEGHAVLDAARAARQVPDVSLADQTVIWGHSQGGHAALWAGQLAAAATDVNVVGTAAMSPASDPRALADRVLAHPDALGASLGISFVLTAYARYYPGVDLDALVEPSARSIVREAAARCTTQGATLITVLTGLSIARDQPIVRPGAVDGSFADLLTSNTPNGPWPAPLFIGQGTADEVIDIGINRDFVGNLCRGDQPVDFREYPGRTHMGVVAPDSPLIDDLVSWTRDRLAGRPATPNCPG
ncbi:lipase [Nakamurella flava]|uniref:Lipase n=1 Tax=Nakamurella flava TaxID=2576308 RepID=A0A4U6Q9A9_9ACTN|nr:lipase [Nakamurella flava]